MELPKRKRIRLPQHNYAENGAYFVTICSHEHTHIFGEITVGQGLCSCRLTAVGKLINEEILALKTRYPHIHIEKYVIMPNHVHLLLSIEATQNQSARAEPLPYGSLVVRQPHKSISDVVCTLKSITTKRANKIDGIAGRKIWQFRFHDHIVRSEEEYQEIAEYIENNPIRWEQDRYCFAAHNQNL